MFIKVDRYNYARKSELLPNRVETMTLSRGDEVPSDWPTAELERAKSLNAVAETREEALTGVTPTGAGRLDPATALPVFEGPGEGQTFRGLSATSSVLGSEAGAMALAAEAERGTLEQRIAGLTAETPAAPTGTLGGVENPGPVTTGEPIPEGAIPGLDGDGSSSTPATSTATSSLSDEELAGMGVEQVHAHVGQYPGDRERVLRLEGAREKPRAGVLRLADD